MNTTPATNVPDATAPPPPEVYETEKARVEVQRNPKVVRLPRADK